MRPVDEYLRSSGYATHVVERGLPGLVANWEAAAEGVESGRPAYICFDEFLNDADGRHILEECLALLDRGELEAVARRVAAADARFSAATVPSRRCIWGEHNAEKHGYTPSRNWYYYRVPRQADETWPADLRGNAD